jgi:hypothetical protein
MHETLDALDPSTAIRHLQHLLVASGALPPRDPGLARLERWIEQFLTEHEDPVLRTFAHWIVLRRCRRNSNRAPLGEGQINTAKTELKSAAALLDWLADRETPLSRVTQADVDAWLAGPSHGSRASPRTTSRSTSRLSRSNSVRPRSRSPGRSRTTSAS